MEEKLLVGITGASGSIYALYFLEALKSLKVPFEIIITDAGKLVFQHELDRPWQILKELTDMVYEEREISAPPASGSAPYRGLVIIPCSMGTLGGIATGQARNLLLRAADVMLKERKPLVLVVRETPFNLIHLQNMLLLTQAGAVIYPAMPGFYHKPASLEELLKQFTERLLQFLKIAENSKPWKGLYS
ncbi:aromatic acid decarboxylase [Caldimicrobium thiodismutans]|uniref:Flavin prenyltransferase UbiX n=1 Tax=Caldimicrobium thiodismutans TaxID=1653476 RepID=A0A0U5AZZ5_9BACT|nr:UbiX family flavin prenyltransferase [Caldimicrobium thiodismutans]BAU24095.1 aromatic acid decarboxylase [Caldimicrobium thiodismutans]